MPVLPSPFLDDFHWCYAKDTTVYWEVVLIRSTFFSIISPSFADFKFSDPP